MKTDDTYKEMVEAYHDHLSYYQKQITYYQKQMTKAFEDCLELINRYQTILNKQI